MRLALCFNSALEYWNYHAESAAPPTSLRMRATDSFLRHSQQAPQKPTPADIEACRNSCETAPVHIMVANPLERIYRQAIICHTFTSNIPNDGIVKISDRIAVCTPEFAFVQMAAKLPFAQLVQLGFELCGGYRYSKSRATFEKRAPITTADKLRKAAQATAFPGCDAATRASKYVLDNSASPRETQLAMMLSLPMKYGGYGLEQPVLNYRIALAKRAGIIGKRELFCDLFWPNAQLAIEYDSDAHHAETLAISRDSQRRVALEVEGITCINVTNARLRNFAAFDETALGVAKLLGKRIQRNKRDFIKRNRRLRESIGISTLEFDQDMYEC